MQMRPVAKRLIELSASSSGGRIEVYLLGRRELVGVRWSACPSSRVGHVLVGAAEVGSGDLTRPGAGQVCVYGTAAMAIYYNISRGSSCPREVLKMLLICLCVFVFTALQVFRKNHSPVQQNCRLCGTSESGRRALPPRLTLGD